MSRALVLATLLAACGGGSTPAPRATAPATPVGKPAPVATPEETPWWEEDPTGIDWATVTYATDEEALALWARLGLDGQNFEYHLSFVPEHPAALREAMARALLREGNFACPAAAKPLSCTKTFLEFPPVGAEHTLADPCLRRELALWALGELDDVVLEGELAADMIALAGLPPPEEELNRAALYRIEDSTLRLQVLDAAERAGNQQIADENLGNLSQTSLETAALHHHIDGAVIALGVDGSLSLYLAALADPALRAETRVHVARELGVFVAALDPSAPEVATIAAALERARSAADCGIAAAAVEALEEFDGAPRPPVLGKNAKADAYARALCVALHKENSATAMRELFERIAPKGVVVEERFQDDQRVRQLWLEYPDEADLDKNGAPDVPEADPDGDGDPSTWIEAQRVPRENMLDIELWDELADALQGCKGPECKHPEHEVRFRLHWKKMKGRLQLDKIERREIIGACGTPSSPS